MVPEQPGWGALIIGGPSGIGKSTVAQQLGLRLGVPWLMVDDLRLAMQRSRVALPERTEALYFFEETPGVWDLPPERLRDALIAVGEVMSPAVEVVVENHIDTASPAIIEGDGILPSLWTLPGVRERAAAGLARGVFVVEPDEGTILTNFRSRGRYEEGRTEEGLHSDARAKWLYGQWLAGEARRYGLPVINPRPWDTLPDRILTAVREPAGGWPLGAR